MPGFWAKGAKGAKGGRRGQAFGLVFRLWREGKGWERGEAGKGGRQGKGAGIAKGGGWQGTVEEWASKGWGQTFELRLNLNEGTLTG